MSYNYRQVDPFARENRPFWGLGFKWLATIAIFVVVVGVIFGPVGLALGWYKAGQDIVSPDNVKQQYSDAYTRFESLKATAGNVCDAEKLVSQDTDQGIKSQHQDQLTAYSQNYRRIAAQYNAAYDNAFQAKHVGPSDLPTTAPELSEAKALYCNK